MANSLNNVAPYFLIGGTVGAIGYFLICDIFHKHSYHHHAFATHHKGKKSEKGEYGGGKKGGGHYKGDKGFYTAKGHHHCNIGSPGCVCTDSSKCRKGSTGKHKGDIGRHQGGSHGGGGHGGGGHHHSSSSFDDFGGDFGDGGGSGSGGDDFFSDYASASSYYNLQQNGDYDPGLADLSHERISFG